MLNSKKSSTSKKKFIPPPVIKGHSFKKKEIEDARINGRLLMISPCISSNCNLKCNYCYSDAGEQKFNNLLGLKEYQEVITQAKELGARVVRIGGWGEPLLDKNIYDPETETFPLIDYSNRLGMDFVLFTNATLITKKIAQVLFSKNVSVIPKINSLKPHIEDKMSGVKGTFERIQKGIHNLIEAGFLNTNPKRFAVFVIISKLNYEELVGLYFLLREWDIIPYFELIVPSGRGKDSRFLVSKEKAKSLFEELLQIDEKYFGYTWKPLPPYVGFKCDKLYYNLVIDTNGEVYPCYGLKMSLGNIKRQSLKEITMTELFWKFRNIKEYMHGKCSICNIPECDFGCRCHAFQMGDTFGEYDMCWQD